MTIRWTILGLLLALAGGLISHQVSARLEHNQRDIAQFYTEHGTVADQYCNEFFRWSQLPLQEKLDTYFADRRRDQHYQTAAQICLAAGMIVCAASLIMILSQHISNRRQNRVSRTATQSATPANIGGATPTIPEQAPVTVDNCWTSHKDHEVQLQQNLWHQSQTPLTDTPDSLTPPAPQNDSAPTPSPDPTASATASDHTAPTNSPADSHEILTDVTPDKSLVKLTEEVSALREFAASQQNHLRKMQDGYDWNILKNFCLRTIRCVDNLDERIERLTDRGEDIHQLEEVRDELVFALESSGLEQFEPELNSDYRGQERNLEVVKERCFTDDPEQVGKIARLVRSGYQYVVSDDNIKIVRAAQVRLFSDAESPEPAEQPVTT